MHRLSIAACVAFSIAAHAQPVVEITFPTPGSSLTGTVTVTGTSTDAAFVDLSIDGGPFRPVAGLADWNLVIEDGALDTGTHSLRARARAAGQLDFDIAFFSYTNSSDGETRFEHPSSVDAEPLGGILYVPEAHDPDGAPSALICYLHGGGGRGSIPQGWEAELEARNIVYIAPDGRFWGLADPDLPRCDDNPNARGECDWCVSAAYVDNDFEPLVGPGEQDILDSIEWAMANHNIDPDRVYLTGFSMGGRGTYQIGLRNPDRFAAIAPMAPPSDMYEIDARRPDACKEGMASDGMGGGTPGDSELTDTLISITSARFLVENACNLPVFHAHGSLDGVAFNIIGTPDQYLHGAHMTSDNSWDQPHAGDPILDFGHTPTLDELRARHPGGYEWHELFTPVAHTYDTRWTQPIFDFFDAHTLVHAPDTVVYKTYTDTHTDAYWLSIDSATPWTDTPAAVRATRDTASNALSLELARTATISIDLDDAGLSTESPLTVTLTRLDEPVFDPALNSDGEPLPPIVRLAGDFSGCGGVAVTLNGTPIDPAQLTTGSLTLGPIDASAPATLVVTRTTDADLAPPHGVLDLADIQAFVAAFVNGEPPADLAPPAGVLDLADIQAFVAAFMAGCD